MVEHLLFKNEAYNTAKQAAEKNQIIQRKGYNSDKYVVYDIRQTKWGLSYGVINLRTHELGQCDLVRPLSVSRMYGMGYYYDDANPQFMDAFEVMILQNGAEQTAGEKRKERQATDTGTASETITDDFIIVDYSEKAIAVFGDTKPVKDELKALGGRFNPKLTHEGRKHAGWIFSKNKENELKNLLTVK